MQTNERKPPSPFRTFLGKFRKQRVALISLGAVMVIIVAGLLAPWLTPFDPHRPVTDQYQAKGIEVNQLTSVSVPLVLRMSDGSQKTGEDVTNLTLQSEDRQIAAARKTGDGVLVNASGDGSTSILIATGELASRFKVVVSSQDDGQVYVSRLYAKTPQYSLKLGESAQVEAAAVLTDGNEVTGLADILAFTEKNKAVEVSKPVANDGFSNSSSSTQGGAGQMNGLVFQSSDSNIVQVTPEGMIQAVGEGIGTVRMSVDGVSTVIPIAVNQPLGAPMPVSVEPGELQIELINAYKHQPPSSLHWFGTDHQNRDIFSRVLLGTRETMLIGFVSVAIGAVIGTILGLVAGYYGRWIDGWITRFTDVLLAFPGILLAIAVIALLGPGVTNIIFAVAVFTIPIFIRIVRGSAMALKEMTYVEAAKSIGVRDSVIIMRHIFPGTMSVVMVYLTMRIGTAILIGASLSFLGLGGDITAPEWGAMLSAAKDNSRNLFHPTFFPGLAIVITVLSFNLLGDGLRDALDPKMKE